MKSNLIYAILCFTLMAVITTSCNKAAGPGPAASSFTIVNAIPSAPALIPNFSGTSNLQYYKTAQTIAASSWVEFGGYLGDVPLAISQSTDTLHTLLKCNVHLDAGTSHTLILTGSLAAPDTIYKADDIVTSSDSVVRVRFINASMGSVPVNINVVGKQASPIVTNLAYKGASKFIVLPAKKADLSYNTSTKTYYYTLEFRNASTSALITTFSLTPVIPIVTTTGASLFKSVSVVLKGAATAPTAMSVNHY